MEIQRKRASAIIIKNKKILLIHRLKYGLDYFVFPGGRVEEAETAEEAVKREVLEETGLTVLSSHPLFEDTIDLTHKKYIFFTCETNDGKPTLGWPETDRQNKDNQYVFEWHELNKVRELNLLPESCKLKFCEKYS
jgi:8-oxo-dGTP diphosphatase